MIVAVVIPQFRLAAALRTRLDVWEQSAYIVDAERGQVLEATPTAHACGVRPGQTVRQARASSPDGVLLLDDTRATAQLWQMLLDAFDVLSPSLEDAGEGTAFIHVGTALTVHDDMRKAGNISRAFSLSAACSAASTRTCAWLLALTAPGTICPLGAERRAIAGVPLALLPRMDQRTLERFAALGISTVGELAALPGGQLGRRFGDTARAWHDLACGVDRKPLTIRTQPRTFSQHGFDDDGISSADRLAFAIREITARLAHELEGNGHQCAGLELNFLLEDNQNHTCLVRFSQPTANAQLMFGLLQARLENIALCAPIIEIHLRADELSEAGSAAAAPLLTLDSEDCTGPLDVVLARIEALLQQPVQQFVRSTGTRSEDGFRRVPFRVTPQPMKATPVLPSAAQPIGYPQSVLIQPPRALTVRCDAVGLPIRVAQMTVIACAGPWRIREERLADGMERDEFDVVLESLEMLRIGREGNKWQLYASYQ